MSTQPEALRLAERLEQGYVAHETVLYPAAAELRRLHAVNVDLLAALKAYQKVGCGNSTDFALQSDAGILARAAIAKAKGDAP